MLEGPRKHVVSTPQTFKLVFLALIFSEKRTSFVPNFFQNFPKFSAKIEPPTEIAAANSFPYIFNSLILDNFYWGKVRKSAHQWPLILLKRLVNDAYFSRKFD